MIKKMIRRLLRIPDQGPALIDCVDYPVSTINGYTGNSLLEKNILFCVISDKNYEKDINEQAIIERYNFSIFKVEKLLDIEKVMLLRSNLGAFDKIINIIEFEQKDYNIFNETGFKDDDALYCMYHLLQVETDYLIENSGSSISSALIIPKMQDHFIVHTLESLFIGLGLPLANHRIIINSLIADGSVEKKHIIETLSFLSSKYGYELNGEILRLGMFL